MSNSKKLVLFSQIWAGIAGADVFAALTADHHWIVAAYFGVAVFSALQSILCSIRSGVTDPSAEGTKRG